MATHDSFAGAISDVGRALGELCQVERSELSASDQMRETLSTTDDWIEHAQGTDYWRAWNQIVDIFSRYGDDHSIERYTSFPSDGCTFIQAVSINFSTRDREVCWLSIEYLETGELYILAEYRNPVTGSPEVLYDDIYPLVDIDVFELNRTVTCLELTSLAHELGSCAAVLDYYMTTYTGWHTQKEWSAIRGVNRQTVNDRNREARQVLEE